MCVGHLIRRADGTGSLNWLNWLNQTQQTGTLVNMTTVWNRRKEAV